MNRLFLIILLIAANILSFPTKSFSAELEPEGTRLRKLQRGFLNIALSPCELSHEVVATQKYYTALPTWIAGLVKGSAKTVGRALVGGYEMLTAPIPLPANYAPILQPEMPWDLLNNKVKPNHPEKIE